MSLTDALLAIGLGHRAAVIGGEVQTGGREVFRLDDGVVVGLFSARKAWRVLIHNEVDDG